MRAIHFVRPSGSPHLEPLCRDWGSMATHWTEDAAGVTCGGCLDALRSLASSARPAPPDGAPTAASMAASRSGA
jgi:hypothetical protein